MAAGGAPPLQTASNKGNFMALRQQLIMPIIEKICKKHGIKIFVEHTRGMFGALIFSDKDVFYIKDINFNINRTASSALAKNKAASSAFLNYFGFNTPHFTMAFDPEKYKKRAIGSSAEDGISFANNIGYPVIVKPNNMSHGDFVCKVNDAGELGAYLENVLADVGMVQIQKFHAGNDYRIVVLGGDIISAYQRIPLNIVADGVHTIKELVERKQKEFIKNGRDTVIDFNDKRIHHKLKSQGLTFDSVVAAAQRIFLHDIANLSTGGESLDLTGSIHKEYADLAIKIAKSLNLDLCGIDIICNDLALPLSDDYVIIEVNSAPGLDNYVYSGKKQQEYIEELYEKVILYLKSTINAQNRQL